MKQLVTCPETGHLEEIEYFTDPLSGRITGVVKCSRFGPNNYAPCPQTCAKRLNKSALAHLTCKGNLKSNQDR